ncbi:hypothetical protein C7974DRAFT_373534 [Boeremia exigua]|uniref:uncharacterized protein n=1 Tax=Boeremia exigua TaxID=749465 RepID=UPI001E8D92F6|nr:uncharacterized protein C7974DRAFT_373534 [Boeremia exigua]KAH6639278.1 hypothetical protein C7974DRAFT_373534 [Boeremia exigua]
MANERSRRDSSDPAAFKQDDRLDTKLIAYIKEEQTSSDESRVKQKPDTRRHRASVACTSCRDRRIRCVVPAGKKACVQCERSSTPCIIKDDDERRRPISRAYVYSLVERVALLEKILRDEGLTVPQPNYPPETRQHSRRSEPTVSADKITSFSSTPQDSSVSDDHTASSPCYSTVAVQDEHQPLVTKKRALAVVDADHSNYQCNKKMRHDSLIMSTDVKEESPVEDTLASAIQYDEPYNFNHTATITPPIQTPFWPMEYDHNGGLTLLLSESQERVVEYRTSTQTEGQLRI